MSGSSPINSNTPFAEDLLRGAAAIAAWLYGDSKFRRRIYHLTATSNFPHFKIGSQIHAKKSDLLAHFDKQCKRR
jgi:hypothetical protein